MAKEFSDYVVFITGAAHGQGRAAALAFAGEGAHIVGYDVVKQLEYPAYGFGTSRELESLKTEVEALGSKCLIFAGDVRNASEVSQAVNKTIETFGKIDVLFNNAGVAAYGYSHELSEQEWDHVLDINLKGAWLVGKAVISNMIEKKAGVIINNSSIAGLRGLNRMSHYTASKYGLIGLTKSWAIELAPYGIRAVSIHPTGVNTPMNDGLAAMEGSTPEEIAERSAGNLLPVPWIEAEDVANAVLFLASKKARYITGSQFVLDAGLLTR